MVSRTSIMAVAGLIALPFWAASQATNAFALAGVVVRNGTNQPLNHVLVTISYTQRRQLHFSYITDTDGRFTFPNLPRGKWDLTAEKNGYPMQFYQGGDEGYSTAVAVGPGLDSTHIVFPLHANGIITGTVLEDEGDPVRQAQVMLFRTGVSYGKLTTQPVGASQTDAAGEFSIGSLRPGTYYVGVSARPWYAKNFSGPATTAGQTSTEPTQHDARDVAYPVTYYGDVTEGASAEPITIQDGAEERIRIILHAVPASRLTLEHGGEHGVVISAFGPGGLPVNLAAPTTITGERVEALGIPVGRYSIRAAGPDQSAEKIIEVAGDQVIDFGGHTPVTLTGHVTWEGSAARASGQAFMSLTAEDQRSYAALRIQSDGSLHLDENHSELTPGRYRMSFQSAPGYVIRSVQARGAQYRDGVLEIAGDKPVDLSITAASNLAQLSGIAVREKAPCSAAMILLLPTDGNPDEIRRDQSDSDGTFTLPDVLPGHYTLIAIDHGPDLAYQDRAVMAKYLAAGRTVNVTEKSQDGLSVPVQQRQP